MICRAAVFLLVVDDTLYSACVGTCRIVLGTNEIREPLFQKIARVENIALAPGKRRRASQLSKKIHYVQLTKDNKPDEDDELARIIECGGRVKRHIDDNGNRIGPYRV